MRIDKDRKVDIWAVDTLKVLDEFCWNAEDMANAIQELRNELGEKEKEIDKLNEELQSKE